MVRKIIAAPLLVFMLGIFALETPPALAQTDDRTPQVVDDGDGGLAYELPGGQKVPFEDHDGNVGEPRPDGSVQYADGLVIGVDSDGVTYIERPDGSVEHPDTPNVTRDSDGNLVYELENGRRIPFEDEQNNVGAPQPDGSVVYADGTRVGIDSGGATYVQKPDGSYEYPDTPDVARDSDGDLAYRLPNGDLAPFEDPDGNVGEPQEDGSVQYANGDVITGRPGEDSLHTAADGETRVLREHDDGAAEDEAQETAEPAPGAPDETGFIAPYVDPMTGVCKGCVNLPSGRRICTNSVRHPNIQSLSWWHCHDERPEGL